jgi:hypothetical protein
LEYRARVEDEAQLKQGALLMFALFGRDCGLRLLLHPQWRSMIDAADLEYIGELLTDFRQRCLIDPEALFLQLASLAVGPLVVRQAGQFVDIDHNLSCLWEQFVEL